MNSIWLVCYCLFDDLLISLGSLFVFRFYIDVVGFINRVAIY